MSVNIALLGWVLYSIGSGIVPANKNAEWLVYIGHNIHWLVLVSVLGLAAIFLLLILKVSLNRMAHLVRVNHHRMREIETQLGMGKNLIIHSLDEARKKKVKKGNIPTGLREHYPPPREGRSVVPWMFYVLIGLWVVFVLVVWFLPLIMEGIQ